MKDNPIEELKPCPFCGGERLELLHDCDCEGSSAVSCKGCFGNMVGRDGHEAVKDWNTRAPSITVEELEPISEALSRISIMVIGGSTQGYLCAAQMQEEARIAHAALQAVIEKLEGA